LQSKPRPLENVVDFAGSQPLNIARLPQENFMNQPPVVQSASAPPVIARQFPNLILTNLETVPGRTIVEHFGLVSGNTVRAKHVGKDIMAGFKNIVGGELKSYTELLTEARLEAIQRMAHQAAQLGANAVVNIRFSTSSITQGAAELYAYGTAVRVQ
jgi:uncharacterized protein YbjQ (UPF0145 family)